MSDMLKGMITEAELLKLMALKPSELKYLRKGKGFPFVKLTIKTRVYLEDDLMEWFKGHRMVLNLDLTPQSTSIDSPATPRYDTPRPQEDTVQGVIQDHAISDTD